MDGTGAAGAANDGTAGAEAGGAHEAAEEPEPAEGTGWRKNSEAAENEGPTPEGGPEAEGNERGTSGEDPTAVATNSGLAERPGRAEARAKAEEVGTGAESRRFCAESPSPGKRVNEFIVLLHK